MNDENLGLSENALTVLKKRYLAKNSNGKRVESPAQLFERVARNIAIIDLLYLEDVYDASGSQQRTEMNPDGDPPEDLPEVSYLSSSDVETLWRAYATLSAAGKIKVDFDSLCELAEERSDLVNSEAEEFYKLMTSQEFLPNSPTLMNAGRELQQLAACFVLPIEDSMQSIFNSIKNAALIHKSGGGTGFSFSRLRPTNDVVRTTGGVASGPISFLKVFNAATEAVKQGGTRRGANMGILRVDHPDIEEFITCKSDDSEITNFNLSVALTEEFMEKLESDEEYDLINPRSGEVVDSLSARKVFERLAEMAWKNGEPGIIFLDRINADNPTPEIGEVESTNPCGEQPLLPYESCNLGSINLAAFANMRDDTMDVDDAIDWTALGKVVDKAVHFLDNVIDANRYPIEEIRKITRANRKIGLGVMGWADMLLKLGIPYDSERAVDLAQRVMGFIDERSKQASVRLAEYRGVFPNWASSVYKDEGIKLRNATTTTIAPTGSISIIGETSSGIEPLFSIAFTRHVLDGEKLVEVNPQFEKYAKSEDFYSDELMQSLAAGESLQEQEEVPEHIRRMFVTALDIDPKWHIKMQAAFQAETDNAVSKTINFPNSATKKDIFDSFRWADELGCKGLTVYRVGSRSEQVLVTGSESEDKEETSDGSDDSKEPRGEWGYLKPIPRTSRLRGLTVRKATPMGNLFLTLNMSDDHPFELFAQIGKAGSDVAAFTEAIARLISLAFRCGVDPSEVADQLIGIGGSRSVGFGPNRVRSVPDAIGQFVEQFLESWEYEEQDESSTDDLTQIDLTELSMRKDAREKNDKKDNSSTNSESNGQEKYSLCPSCGLSALTFQEGCVVCVACAYTEC